MLTSIENKIVTYPIRRSAVLFVSNAKFSWQILNVSDDYGSRILR